ncbi:MAG TPA: serine hydrolase domain-containing protein [Chryseosolibacter sp.]
MPKRKSKIKIVVVVVLLIAIAAFVVSLVQDFAETEKAAPVKVDLPASIEPNPYFEDLLTDYENDIRDLQAKTKTPGYAIVVVHDTTVIYQKGFGLRQVDRQDSVDIHTVFRLASVSKCFAPILTGLLVEDGILSWDDPIVKYLPDFKLISAEATNALTIRHVLSHTTGLPYHTYTNMVEEGKELKEMLGMLKDVKLTGMPGEIYSYQNVAYSLIAEVVQAATGKSYEQLMQERIFNPLHMKDASMNYDAILSNLNVARPHLLWRKGWRVTSINDTYYNVSPAGGINASISDMGQILKVLLGSKTDFIRTSTLEEIFKPAVKAQSKNRNFRKWISRSDSYYALGWRVLNFKTDTLLYHGGYVNGYRSELAINRRDKIGICVLSNGPGNLVDNSVPYFFKLYFNDRDSIVWWERKERRNTAEP